MWARRRPLALRVADKLGRSRGRMRLLDRLGSPAASPEPIRSIPLVSASACA
jgi:hypothetical protein